jgi:hypothetical protein
MEETHWVNLLEVVFTSIPFLHLKNPFQKDSFSLNNSEKIEIKRASNIIEALFFHLLHQNNIMGKLLI